MAGLVCQCAETLCNVCLACNSRCGEVCSHVAAVLFKVEACIRLKIASRTCTDLPCVWNQAFSKNVSVFQVKLLLLVIALS